MEVFVLELVEHFLEERGDEQAAGFGGIDAARLEVELLFGVDAGARAAVEHFTSLAWISRPGRLWASAASESIRLRFF